ncbi:hypothetical protein NUW54_g14615 [Trametes sanguinea]|uniref:Uncharacterized protein n=1 Tax=Trametes sanguinea TaxID=158606 RepID=A0ACC1MDA3_9APHY|nr:hypothetical protein NUW54_g14615 [Trametes sanguinea]
MPLNSLPPTTTVANLEDKRRAARGQCWTDVAFWGGVIPGNQIHLKPLVGAGVKGFKCFLIESGVDEFPCVDESDLRAAMAELQGTSTVLCFHAELQKSPGAPSTADPSDPTLYSTFLASRPQQLEVDAIELITRLHSEFPSLRLHIVHLSASAALPLVRAAKAAGRRLTVETCFHYTNRAGRISHDRSVAVDVHVTQAEEILNKRSGPSRRGARAESRRGRRRERTSGSSPSTCSWTGSWGIWARTT